jgi:hypothetical protein
MIGRTASGFLRLRTLPSKFVEIFCDLHDASRQDARRMLPATADMARLSRQMELGVPTRWVASTRTKQLTMDK